MLNNYFIGFEETSSYWSSQFFSVFLWSQSIGRYLNKGRVIYHQVGQGCVFVVVAVGWGGRVHFYMIHIFTNLPVSPGSFGPLKVGVKEFMILPLTFL